MSGHNSRRLDNEQRGRGRGEGDGGTGDGARLGCVQGNWLANLLASCIDCSSINATLDRLERQVMNINNMHNNVQRPQRRRTVGQRHVNVIIKNDMANYL